jgi:hypothetical protein
VVGFGSFVILQAMECWAYTSKPAVFDSAADKNLVSWRTQYLDIYAKQILNTGSDWGEIDQASTEFAEAGRAVCFPVMPLD